MCCQPPALPSDLPAGLRDTPGWPVRRNRRGERRMRLMARDRDTTGEPGRLGARELGARELGARELGARELAAFERHLTAERGLSPHTVRAYLTDVAGL